MRDDRTTENSLIRIAASKKGFPGLQNVLPSFSLSLVFFCLPISDEAKFARVSPIVDSFRVLVTGGACSVRIGLK